MMKRMIEKALPEQVERINKIIDSDCNEYTVADVFNMLPTKIEYRDRTGYLKISKFDIVYSCLELERENKVVIMWSFMVGNQNIFDAFIDALEWFKKFKSDVKIIEV